MSDVSSQGVAIGTVPARALFNAANGREKRPPDDEEAPPEGPREPSCPPSPLRRDEKAGLPQRSSRRRLPTGLY